MPNLLKGTSCHDTAEGEYTTDVINVSAEALHARGPAPWQIRKVSGYIEAHLDSTIGAADLAG
jgi:hypothetical protein